METIYLIGSLRNPKVPEVARQLRAEGYDVFDDWFAAGPEADDWWQKYEKEKGLNYAQALRSYAAKHVYEFDLTHIQRADIGILLMPAGKSGHLELGYLAGSGKRTYVLFPPEEEMKKLPEQWKWLAGLYEGEGSLTRNGKKNTHGLQLTITMKDKDIIDRACVIAGRGTVTGPYTKDNPKWAPMWRWSSRRREDVLYLVRGMWNELGIRRKEQITKVLGEAGIEREFLSGPSPYEFRWDVMYQFCNGVYFNVEDLIQELGRNKTVRDGSDEGPGSGEVRPGGFFEPYSDEAFLQVYASPSVTTRRWAAYLRQLAERYT